MRARSGVAVGVLAVMAAALPAYGLKDEGRGFGKLTLGQSIAQVQKIYPHIRQLEREEFGAAVVYNPKISRYYQEDAKLAGLPQPVSLELRFWNEHLWVIIGYFGGNTGEQVVAMLQKRYGKPTTVQPDPTWMGKNVTVVTTPRQKWFSINDNAISQEVQALFMDEMRRMQQRQQPPPAPPAQPPVQ